MSEWVSAGSYCPNKACRDYGKVDAGSIMRQGKSRTGRQRFQCKSCRVTFNERSGSVFYNRKTEAADIVECLALLAQGVRISSISRVKGIKEVTILSLLRQAVEQAEGIEAIVLHDYPISQVEIDGLWA